MGADLVLGSDGFGAGAGVGLAEQEAAGQSGGFLFLFGVAGDERVADELLYFPDVIVGLQPIDCPANARSSADPQGSHPYATSWSHPSGP